MVDSVSESRRVFYGTAVEREALDTATLEILDCFKANNGDEHVWLGAWVQTITGGAAHTFDQFRLSSYSDLPLTMDDTAQGVALATATTKIQVTNTGATGLTCQLAFGTSELDAEENLNIAGDGSTTGALILPAVDGAGSYVFGVPANATHYAIANTDTGDTPIVYIAQGV